MTDLPGLGMLQADTERFAKEFELEELSQWLEDMNLQNVLAILRQETNGARSARTVRAAQLTARWSCFLRVV